MSSANVTDDSFEQDVLKSSKPVVVDFWAEWCGPCKMMSPIVDEIANELGEDIKITKVNIDENPNTPTQYGVMGIPTFMVFKDGELVGTKSGGMSKEALQEWIKSNAA